MIKIYFYMLISLSTLFSQIVPLRFLEETSSLDEIQEGLKSNVIVEIKTSINPTDSIIWLGTGKGLSYQLDSLGGNSNFRTFNVSNNLTNGTKSTYLPSGGVSAIAIAGKKINPTTGNDTLIVSVANSKDGESVGAGIVIGNFSRKSPTNPIEWEFFEQPIDNQDDSTITWGGLEISALPVTVFENNITYDLSVGKEYYWAASWAGGLRRLKKQNEGNSIRNWERVPLPDDNRSSFNCGEFYENYQLNPRDPPDGNHNHKVFSVLVYSDTIWVGTANGINRGIIDRSSTNNCINWKHYSFPNDGISGNWVISIAKQQWNGKTTIWAVTRSANEVGENSGVSYSRNDGETWSNINSLMDQYGYNIVVQDSLVYFASRNGLWKSIDGENFALYGPAIDKLRNDQIIDNDVFSVLHDTRNYYSNQLWIGSADGLGRLHTPGFNAPIWQIYRSNYSSNKPYAYPNPFSPSIHNLMNGDGYLRFYYKVKQSDLIKLTIYNFAMQKVREIDYFRGIGQGSLKWDGRDDSGYLVSNGTYFCKLFYDNTSHWVKVVLVK
ncbi:MAG: hypothetical protein CMF98_05415 [Candidatus Marinimicrobia bacterium]|nr:hypothetical protein [Candidatus Neomarinimicrobiota bacterium]OUW50094.1 MAG: hypothetical protein CBD50_03950 [bacterium TMED190]|tara:strand:+ start:1778 stop:3430 length:1653 start_codon:yes stop_codon:yes gene_type:complete